MVLEEWFKVMMAVWLLQERQKEFLIMRLAEQLNMETGYDGAALKVIQEFLKEHGR